MMDNSNNQKRIEIKLQRQLNKLVLPILLETLLTFLLGGVDTFMLSQHSDDAVAAVGMDNQILQLVFLLFTIINAGTSVLCSQYFGAKLQDRFVKVSGVALMLNLTMGLMSSLLLFLFAEPVLCASVNGTSPRTYDLRKAISPDSRLSCLCASYNYNH